MYGDEADAAAGVFLLGLVTSELEGEGQRDDATDYFGLAFGGDGVFGANPDTGAGSGLYK